MTSILKRHALGLAALLILSLPAAAASVATCSNDDFTARADNIAEPWEKNTKTFSGGKIRVALLDTFEPACCSWHILVISPSQSEEGDVRACRIVSDTPGTGFGAVDFAKLTSSYDPKKGLLLLIPYRQYDFGEDNLGRPGKSQIMKIRINQATGVVSVEK